MARVQCKKIEDTWYSLWPLNFNQLFYFTNFPISDRDWSASLSVCFSIFLNNSTDKRKTTCDIMGLCSSLQKTCRIYALIFTFVFTVGFILNGSTKGTQHCVAYVSRNNLVFVLKQYFLMIFREFELKKTIYFSL